MLPMKSSAEDILKLEMTRTPLNYFDILPAELIGHIFLIGVRDERHDPKGMARAPFNLIVSSVCQRWRDIALSTPAMWQYITMSEADPEYRWTQLWLERSKEVPLDIDLYWSDAGDLPGLADDETCRIRDILIPHARRWREFSFNVDTFEMNHIMLQALSELQEPLPLLEGLMLYNNDDFEPEDLFTPTHLRSPIDVPSTIFPRVRQVELWGVHIAWESWPFKNLTRLALSYHTHDIQYSPAQFISMLNSSPNLEYLKLNGSGPFPFGTNLETPFTLQLTLPSLRALHLSFIYEPLHILFLTHLLRAPNLESLTIKDWYEGDFSAVISLMGVSSNAERARNRFGYPSVTRLSIGGITTLNVNHGVRAFTELFRDMKNVTHLMINCKEMDQDIFESLIVPKGEVGTIVPQDGEGSESDRVGDVGSSCNGTELGVSLLPSLGTLKPIGIPWQDVSAFLSKRQEQGRPLSHVLIRRPAVESNALPPPIEEWKRFGCEAEFYDEDSEDEEGDSEEDGSSLSSGWTTDPDDDEDEDETEDDQEEGGNVGMADGESDPLGEVGNQGHGNYDTESASEGSESSLDDLGPETIEGDLGAGSTSEGSDYSVSTDELNL